jgi:hypothetical protein
MGVGKEAAAAAVATDYIPASKAMGSPDWSAYGFTPSVS